MKKYILELTVFLCGAIVMMFELAGSRVLGPYFGTSIFVWTSLIGIILASLSFGYCLGGIIADKKPSLNLLSFIILLSAASLTLTILIKTPLLGLLQASLTNIKINSVIASLILFAPTSILLGIISPYAAKLKINNLDRSGATVGNLYAISTAGSILGTFLAGFYLIARFGTNQLLIILAVTLVVNSFILSPQSLSRLKIFLFIVISLDWLIIGQLDLVSARHGSINIDTGYSHVQIYDYLHPANYQPARMMQINSENHSAMFLANDELVNEYTKYYHLAKHFCPDFNHTLMLGGAGYSFPKNFLLTYPHARMDVVEIDPGITALAERYFSLKPDQRLNIYHQDGRVYLNQTDKKYDVIFGDAFGSRYSLPYQLATKEAIQKQYDLLTDHGVIILNLISAIDGDQGQFLRAEYATYRTIFPQVYLFSVKNQDSSQTVQNIILVALKSVQLPSLTNPDPSLDEYLKHLWKKSVNLDMPILTDDYAPVDYYINKII